MLRRFVKKKYAVIFLLLVSLVLLYTCKSIYTATGKKWNLAAIINPVASSFHPSYRVYHTGTDSSVLMVKLFPSELLFNQAGESGYFTAEVTIQVQNYDITGKNPVMVDSTTHSYHINQEDVGRRFITQVSFKSDTGKRYQLRVVARDNKRDDFNLQFINVDKQSVFSAQNFRVLNNNNIPYFNNVMLPGAIFKVEHRLKGYSKLYIDYYAADPPVPSASFPSVSDSKVFNTPDSSYVIDYEPNLLLAHEDEGLYRLRFDTAYPEGLIIVNFGTDFPKIKTVNELIYPLSYIATKPEYQTLLNCNNKKLETDNFWLELAGTTGRAKEMIRIYYNRVYFANYYFSGSRPGWKTDRGMIYVVYGPPHNMEKTAETETWLYYQPGGGRTIRITFDYTPGIFDLNSFNLRHSESQEWYWKEAYDSWRAGRIFLQD